MALEAALLTESFVIAVSGAVLLLHPAEVKARMAAQRKIEILDVMASASSLVNVRAKLLV
jgi:hypothetical protein